MRVRGMRPEVRQQLGQEKALARAHVGQTVQLPDIGLRQIVHASQFTEEAHEGTPLGNRRRIRRILYVCVCVWRPQVHGNGKLDSDGNYDSEDSNCSSGGSIRVTDSSCATTAAGVVSPGNHHAHTPSVLHPAIASALPLPTPPTSSDW